MSETLSPGEIVALFAAAERGELPAEQEGEERKRHGRRVRPVDFTRPIKFTPDQVRRIRQSLERFCQAAATNLTAELGSVTEVELIDTAQLTWWDAHQQLGKDVLCTVLDAPPVGTKLLLATELSFALLALEHLMGGAPAERPRSRRLTEVDRRLARRLTEGLVQQLAHPWHEMCGLALRIEDFDVPADDTQLAPASEPTLVMTVELRLTRSSHTLSLLLPYSAVAPVEDILLGRSDVSSAARQPELQAALHSTLSVVDVTLRAAAPSVEMSLEEVLALAPGDVIRLNAPVAAGVTLYADDQPLWRAVPGRSGARRAVQVLGAAEKGPR